MLFRSLGEIACEKEGGSDKRSNRGHERERRVGRMAGDSWQMTTALDISWNSMSLKIDGISRFFSLEF